MVERMVVCLVGSMAEWMVEYSAAHLAALMAVWTVIQWVDPSAGLKVEL
jgi:hypothetical protein